MASAYQWRRAARLLTRVDNTRNPSYYFVNSPNSEINPRVGEETFINKVFKALADPTRRDILRELQAGEKRAGELADKFPLAKSTLSGHFTVLKHADLIVSERRGTSIVYRLNASVFEEAMSYLLDFFAVGNSKEKDAYEISS